MKQWYEIRMFDYCDTSGPPFDLGVDYKLLTDEERAGYGKGRAADIEYAFKVISRPPFKWLEEHYNRLIKWRSTIDAKIEELEPYL